ncbi:hypothetical protein L6164_020629 [Bauhinia variegata]|uniref:Uncharacterized protein n=1 Tax=Bauhinia variegata TaxID=167791 RepID=A0ACB9MVZ7_BAUVA|nr:hypothetical protein L6164_020629 [Bauhinia variegata]
MAVTGDNGEILDDGLEIETLSRRLKLHGNEDLPRNELTRVENETQEWNLIRKSFLMGMGCMGRVTDIVAIHKNKSTGNLEKQARLDSFRIFSKAVADKCNGNPNMRFAWYGGSLKELLEILHLGFSGCRRIQTEDNSHGVGICLSPAKFSIDGAVAAVADEDGMRHVLLCKVALGRVEVVPCGSGSGSPAPSKTLRPRIAQWTSFPNLMAKLSKFLEPSKMALLVRGYSDYQEHKMSRPQWIKKVKEIVGERLLLSMIRNRR